MSTNLSQTSGAAPTATRAQSPTQPPSPQQNPMLQDLRDIHEPEPVPTWPPAPGWWIVTLLLLAALAYLTRRAVIYNRKRAYRREALHELMIIREAYRSTGNGSAYAEAMLELLKRTALTAYPSDSARIAGLHGEDWLKFLDDTCAQCNFRSEEGRGLVRAAYSGRGEQTALHHGHVQARLWIVAHRAQGGLLRA